MKRERDKRKTDQTPCYFLSIAILSGLKKKKKTSQSFKTNKKTLF